VIPDLAAVQLPDGGLRPSGEPIGHRTPRTILLLEPDPARAGRIRLALMALATSRLRVEWAATLPDALERLGRAEIEAVLLGGRLCDGDRADIPDLVRRARPDVRVWQMCRAGVEAEQLERLPAEMALTP
jgi:DNA-binding NtrC family response regulator